MPATLTYTPQNPAGILRADSCDPRRPMNPLTGIWSTHRTTLGYREASPHGDSPPFRITATYPVLHQSILHSTFFILHWTYTFSAKEKDSETGLSYFGSRYYSSDLSVWLSVDPMSDKYPYQSNYVYCGNNPIKVVDPNGEDEWEVNENTGLIKHYSNDKPDRLFVTTADGQRKDDVAPLDVDRTVMQQMLSDGTQTAFTAMDKRNEMNQMFDYLADNTFVEWTHIGASYFIENEGGGETKNYDMILTRHQFTSCNMRGDLKDFAAGGVLDFHKHSHPNKYLGDNPYYRIMYPTTSHIPSSADHANKNNYPIPNVPFKQPFFLLRNGKRNIYY